MITRFAPSPTGPLHLGHAFSALTVWQVAAEHGGTALLRIEDTDSTRARAEHEARIYDDLAWLGLEWPLPVRRQSEHQIDYDAVLEQLNASGLIYPCACTRRQIIDAGAIPGADGMIYPGTCRGRCMFEADPSDAVRLDVEKALALLNGDLHYFETGHGSAQNVVIAPETLITDIGDPVLRRKDTGDPSYHLACVHDDAHQQITHVVRGQDLQELTPLHVLMQNLLEYPTPIYHHHRLITDCDGRRLAKIDKSKALAKYRQEGLSPADVKQLIGFID